MADWSDFKPDTASGSGWEGFQPDPPSLVQRLKTGAGQVMQGVRAGLDIATGAPAESSMTGQNVPSMQEGTDPLAIASRHPYAVAAATGGAMGPTMGIGALANVPGVAPAIGAAEQMGYQAINDVGQRIAGPKHPILGAIPGIVAPMLSPAATMAGGGRVAAKAATEAEMQRAAQAQAEGLAEQKLAVTAPQAAALARPTQINPQEAQQLQAAKAAVWQQRRDALKTVGRQYDPIFEKVDAMPLTPEHAQSISQGIADAGKTVAARGRTLSPATSKLFDEIGNVRGAGIQPDEATIAEVMSAKPDPAMKGAVDRYKQLQLDWAAEHGGEKLPRGGLKDMARQAIVEQQSGSQKIGQLRGQLARLRQAADSPSISAVERSAIFDASKPIIQVLDSVIPDEQKPILASINAQYAQVNKLLPFKGMKAMNSAGTLPDLGEAMFAKPNAPATAMVLGQMNDAQKGLMRDAFASWALSKKGTGKELFNELASQKDNIARLGFPPELSSVGQWNELVTGANRMKTLPGLPAQKDFVRGVQEEIKKAGFSQQALNAADDALRQKQNLGYAGRRLLVGLPLMGMMGYGVLVRQPEMIAPIATLGAAYLAKRAMVNSPTLLPMYRDFVMGGWTRQGGTAFGKMLVSQLRDGVQAAAAPTLRPDKEREAEAMP